MDAYRKFFNAEFVRADVRPDDRVHLRTTQGQYTLRLPSGGGSALLRAAHTLAAECALCVVAGQWGVQPYVQRVGVA